MNYMKILKFQCPKCQRCWESLRRAANAQPCPYCFTKDVTPGYVNSVYPLREVLRLPECRHDPLEPTTCDHCADHTEKEPWLWACPVCGCTDVEESIWREANTGHYLSACLSEFWCPQCECENKSIEHRAVEQPFKEEREQKAEGA